MSEANPTAPSEFSLGIEAFNVESFQEMLHGRVLGDRDVFVFFDAHVCFNCADFYQLFE
jgi:hypothetical protein